MAAIMEIKYLISIVVLCIEGACTQQLSVGNLCLLNSTRDEGVCKLFKDCDKSHEDLKQRIFPQICGFQGKESIVCCEKNEEKQQRNPGDISKIKCKEYSKYVYQKRRSPILSVEAPVIERNECGHKVVKLIIGGEPATRKEFPHMAAIGYGTNTEKIEWACGGTIISDSYILTAGHCLSARYGSAQYVKVGVTDLNDKSKFKQEFEVVELIPYPQYNPPSHYHDIGLIKLNRPIRMNSFARPACLYLDKEVRAARAIATGWGITNEGVTSNNLMKVTLELFGHQHCNTSYGNQITRRLTNGIMDDVQMCAGTEDEDKEKDTCQGDSGGPLQIYHNGDDIKCMYDIIGVTSFGKACGTSLGVYARVSHYIKWIEDIVWP